MRRLWWIFRAARFARTQLPGWSWRLCWYVADAVMELHPPRSTWVNNHQFCLYLWRPTRLVVPLPPQWMVGDPSIGTLA